MLPKSSPEGRASSSLSRWLAAAADAPCAPAVVAVGWLGAVVSAGFVSVDDSFWSAAPMSDMVSSVDMNTPCSADCLGASQSFARRSDRGSLNLPLPWAAVFLSAIESEYGMRGCEPKGVEKKVYVFDFRCARSHQPESNQSPAA